MVFDQPGTAGPGEPVLRCCTAGADGGHAEGGPGGFVFPKLAVFFHCPCLIGECLRPENSTYLAFSSPELLYDGCGHPELFCGARTLSLRRYPLCQARRRACLGNTSPTLRPRPVHQGPQDPHDKDGKPVRSHRLMLSQRVGDRVRHRTLLHGFPPLLEAAPDVQAEPRTSSPGSGPGGRSEPVQEEARQPDIATVAFDTLEHERPPAQGRLRAPVPQGPRRSRLRRNPPRPGHQGPRRAHRAR